MPTITLNNTNITNSNTNNILTYKFQNGNVEFKNNYIALANMSLYYSWFNINQQLYKNNQFNYKWFDGLTYNVIIPNGQYSVSGLNNFFKSVMTNNNHYLINIATGDFVYYLEFEENATFYSIQYNAYLSPLPATIGVTYNYPLGATWVVPIVSKTSQIIILTSPQFNFNNVIGFTSGTYPTLPSLTTYSKLSDYTPEIEPISSLNILCSFISNPFSNTKIIYSTGIPSVSFGQQITISPPNFIYNGILDGIYQSFTVEIVDQNNNPIQILDPQINIVLNIKESGTNQ